MMVDSSRVDVGRTAAGEDGSEGEGEEQAEVEDMKCARGMCSMGLGEPPGVGKQTTFVRG